MPGKLGWSLCLPSSCAILWQCICCKTALLWKRFGPFWAIPIGLPPKFMPGFFSRRCNKNIKRFIRGGGNNSRRSRKEVIHYDNPNNILPWGIWNDGGEEYYDRAEDINIFQYDYNTLFLDNYKEALGDPDFEKGYRDQLYTSVSSMSVVTAGFVAMLKEVDDTLTPAEYKEILTATSHPAEYAGEKAEHVADIGAAVRYLMETV